MKPRWSTLAASTKTHEEGRVRGDLSTTRGQTDDDGQGDEEVQAAEQEMPAPRQHRGPARTPDGLDHPRRCRTAAVGANKEEQAAHERPDGEQPGPGPRIGKMMLLVRISVNESTWTTITVGIAAMPGAGPRAHAAVLERLHDHPASRP